MTPGRVIRTGAAEEAAVGAGPAAGGSVTEVRAPSGYSPSRQTERREKRWRQSYNKTNEEISEGIGFGKIQ